MAPELRLQRQFVAIPVSQRFINRIEQESLQSLSNFEGQSTCVYMASVQKVLLIDDDDIVNSINRVIINHAKFAEDVQTISEAKDALLFIQEKENKEHLPDMIFLDLNMPNMDGWDFVEAFDQLDLEKPIKIVMLTSSISQADQKKAQSYKSICAFLSKPLSPELLENLEREKLSSPS